MYFVTAILLGMCAAFNLFTYTAKAQAATTPINDDVYPIISLHGELRYRGELDGRFFSYDAKPLFFNLLRTSFGADVRLDKDIRLTITFRDSRNFGEEDGALWRGTLDGSGDNFNLFRGFLTWDNFLTDGLRLEVGRMGLSTNNERIIGNLDWHNVGRAYDGATLAYNIGDGYSARAFAALLGTDELLMSSAPRQQPQALAGVEVNLPFQDKLNVYMYHDRNGAPIASGVAQGQASLERYTAGVYVKNVLKEYDIEYEAEAAYQFGQRANGTAARSDIKGLLLTGYAGYTSKTATAGLGFDFYTGNDAATTEREDFDHLFFTIHKFYGFMDFLPFTIVPSSGQRQPLNAIAGKGLINPYIRATWQAADNIKLNFWTHYFRSQQAISWDGQQLYDIGIETDLVADVRINKFVSAQLGASVFLPGDAVKTTNAAAGYGDKPAYWAYSMLTVKF